MEQIERSSLSVSLAGFSPRDVGLGESDRVDAENVRGVLGWLSARGVSGVQLDAMSSGLRPRELDRSARRDLASVLRRFELELSGVDLWIPPGHFVDGLHSDRAVEAVGEAVRFVVEMVGLVGGSGGSGVGVGVGGGVVCVTLPAFEEGDVGVGGVGFRGGVVSAIESAAELVGGVVADCSVGAVGSVSAGGGDRGGGLVGGRGIGIGVDPAAVLAGGADVGAVVVRAGERLVCARLSDADHAGRAVVGRGHLDVEGYAGALAAVGFRGRVVVDVRGLRRSVTGVDAAIERWPRFGR